MGLLLFKTYSSLNIGLNTICFFSSGTTLFDFCFKSENLQLIIYKLKSYSYLDHGHMLLKYVLNLIQFLISNLTWDQSIEKKNLIQIWNFLPNQLFLDSSHHSVYSCSGAQEVHQCQDAYTRQLNLSYKLALYQF